MSQYIISSEWKYSLLVYFSRPLLFVVCIILSILHILEYIDTFYFCMNNFLFVLSWRLPCSSMVQTSILWITYALSSCACFFPVQQPFYICCVCRIVIQCLNCWCDSLMKYVSIYENWSFFGLLWWCYKTHLLHL